MIRQYRQEDLPAVVKIVRAGTRLDQDTVSRRLGAGDSLVYDDGMIKGVGVAKKPNPGNREQRLDLWLYVEPGSRRTGIGGLLFDRLRSEIRGPAVLETGYRADQGHARSFFAARGFEKWFTMTVLRYTGPSLPEPSLAVCPPSEQWLKQYIDLVNQSFFHLRKQLDIRPFAPYFPNAHTDEKTRQDILNNRDNSFWFFDGEDLVGIGEVDDRDFIDLVAVRPDWRQRGYGRAITGFCINRLRQRGASTIVTSVLEINAAARRLYEGMSFEQFEVYEEARLRLPPG